MMTTSSSSSIIISLALQLSLFFPRLILSAQQPADDMVYLKCFIENGTYNNMTSPYRTNLNNLLSNFTSYPDNDSGFYTSSVGKNPNTIYAQGLCRGDVDPDTCRSCRNNATISLLKLCPNNMRAFGYYDYCTLQYSNSPLQGMYLDPSFSYSPNSPQDAADGKSFTSALNDLMQELKSDASDGDDDLQVALGSQKADKNETVYVLAQCMPDLSQKDCEACLENAISQIPGCQNKVGRRVIKLSCNLRFEKIQFYNDI